MTRTTYWTLACALALPACEEEDKGSDEGADPSTSSGATDEGSASGSTSATPTTAPVSSEEAGPGSEAGSGTASCEPEDGDDECNLCTKAECCEELQNCFTDPICECMTGCATGLNDIPMCTDMCGQATTFSALTSCVTISCASECI